MADSDSDSAQWRKDVMDAVNAGDVAQLAKLLEGADRQHGYLDFRVGKSTTPLIQAVCEGNSDLVEQLLCAGASVDFPDHLLRTPLMHAACSADKHISHVLLSHGANVNAMNAFKMQALHCTILFSDDVETASLLLEYGAELHDLANLNDPLTESQFRTVIVFDSVHLLKLFLHHADKRRMHISLEILYNMAIRWNSEKCAIFTLQQGCHPRSSGDFSSNKSCFHEAADRGLIKLMSFMLESNPHFMQEDWLVHKDFPSRLHKHSDFVSWLVEQRRHPRSLVKLCRSRILARLDTYYIRKVAELPLPNALKTFLKNVESAYVQECET